MWILKNKEVGKRLKIAREQRNLSPRQFALRAGIDQSQYLKIEKGILPITENTMAKLVATYELKQNQILYGNNPPTEALLGDAQAEYHITVRQKVESHEALLSILINEVAVLKSSGSGEHPEVIIKKIYKAADDVAKLGKE